jgi:hypothetical protein
MTTVPTTSGKKTLSNLALIEVPHTRCNGKESGPAAAASPVPSSTNATAVLSAIGIASLP